MKPRKALCTLLAIILYGVSAASCGRASSSDLEQIEVITREEGSGTRSAFVELFNIVDENGGDIITDSAEATSSTAVMMTTIAGNKSAIGYTSLGSISSDVKTLKIDGIEPTVESIKTGTYKISRPFIIAYKEQSISELARDFLSFILSSEGQSVIAEHGYIGVSDSGTYTPSELSGKVTLAGSTSVAPVIEKIADAYKKLNPGVTIEIQQSGSSAGLSSAIEGVCDFGMASRELKDSESEKLTGIEIAIDGIAVIVNKLNPIDNLSSEQVKQIYTGEITKWSELS